MTALGEELEQLVRRIVRAELQAARDDQGDDTRDVENDDVAALAREDAIRMRRARGAR